MFFDPAVSGQRSLGSRVPNSAGKKKEYKIHLFICAYKSYQNGRTLAKFLYYPISKYTGVNLKTSFCFLIIF